MQTQAQSDTTLSSEHKAAIRKETIGTAIANGVLAAFFVWLLVPNTGKALTGAEGLDIDIVVTTFLTILLMSLVMTPLIRRQIRMGLVAEAQLDWSQDGLLRRLSPKTGARSWILAFIGTAILSPPLIAIIYGLGIDPWPFQLVLAAKIGYGIILGILFGPIIALAALNKPPAVEKK
jgi:hypothetical protein